MLCGNVLLQSYKVFYQEFILLIFVNCTKIVHSYKFLCIKDCRNRTLFYPYIIGAHQLIDFDLEADALSKRDSKILFFLY
jgi:hypothetical protein